MICEFEAYRISGDGNAVLLPRKPVPSPQFIASWGPYEAKEFDHITKVSIASWQNTMNRLSISIAHKLSPHARHNNPWRTPSLRQSIADN